MLEAGLFFASPFAEGEAEALRGPVTCPRLNCQQAAELRLRADACPAPDGASNHHYGSPPALEPVLPARGLRCHQHPSLENEALVRMDSRGRQTLSTLQEASWIFTCVL